jgi:hypothetical protein
MSRVEFIDLNAKLKPLNLGQGFPDFMPAEKVVKELAKTCSTDASPLLHQYTRGYVRSRSDSMQTFVVNCKILSRK